jgi:hypothetical protein
MLIGYKRNPQTAPLTSTATLLDRVSHQINQINLTGGAASATGTVATGEVCSVAALPRHLRSAQNTQIGRKWHFSDIAQVANSVAIEV